MKPSILIILAASTALFPAVPAAAAQAAPVAEQSDEGKLPLETGEGRKVANALADRLIANFVFPKNAQDYAAVLRNNAAAGRYDKGTRAGLADMLTDDVQAVHKDGHLHVMLTDPPAEAGGTPVPQGPPKGRPPLIQSARTLAPGIGYIRFTAFAGRDGEIEAVQKWLTENRDAKTLIFDLRNHHGGGLAEQDTIFASIFAKKTPLVKMAISKALYEKEGAPFKPQPTMGFAAEGDTMVGTHVAIPGPDTPLRKARVYLLVSNKTASAAEHFSLAMKSTGRGTLIGEPTAGANHFGGPDTLTDHFAVWMPIGRTYDIKTGKDWEGSGVAPDIAVDPKEALVVALEKAGLSHDQAVKLDAEEVPAEPVHAEKLRAR